MQVYDRRTKEIVTEPQYRAGALGFIYQQWAGRLLRRLVTGSLYSRLHAKRMRRPGSRELIPEFVAQHNIDLNEFEAREYSSFADFFERQFKPGVRPIAPPPALIAPADSRLLVYDINDDGRIPVKGLSYTVEELLRDAALARAFTGGSCLVYRLTVSDCHHYIHTHNGSELERRSISGRLHTVSAFSDRFKVWAENKREFQLQVVGDCRMITMEVGALQVGAIHNLPPAPFRRGDPKGHFSLGGSTIVQLWPANSVQLAEDILAQSAAGIETKVQSGEAIGELLC